MFEIKQDSETIENIRQLVNRKAWTDFFAPVLLQTRAVAIQQLVDPSEERTRQTPDNFLRAQVQTIDAILSIGHATVDGWDQNQRNAEAAADLDERYGLRAQEGRMAPYPEEDDPLEGA